MTVLNDPMDNEVWVREHVCPVCSNTSSVVMYREGLARENLRDNTMYFIDTQPLYIMQCQKCGHCGKYSIEYKAALDSFYNDPIDPEEYEWVKELYK